MPVARVTRETVELALSPTDVTRSEIFSAALLLSPTDFVRSSAMTAEEVGLGATILCSNTSFLFAAFMLARAAALASISAGVSDGSGLTSSSSSSRRTIEAAARRSALI